MKTGAWRVGAGLLALGWIGGVATAQTQGYGPAVVTSPDAQGSPAPDWMKRLAIDPDSPAAKRYAQQQKARRAAEKELKKLRFTCFGQSRQASLRQEGIARLHDFTDPAIFPSMIEIFAREGTDVKRALADIFENAACREGDSSLAWMGVFEKDESARADAVTRLGRRVKASPDEARLAAQMVVYEGLRTGRDEVMSASAKMAQALQLVEAIPMLIAAQVRGTAAGSSTGDAAADANGALAWIAIGQQTAFVSDLTPVVGPSAVAFDPQLSVITTGVILRVVDAVVYTYHVDVHEALIGLSEGAWGHPTRQLGWSTPDWSKWYLKEFRPFWEEKQKELAKGAEQAKNGATPAPK